MRRGAKERSEEELRGGGGGEEEEEEDEVRRRRRGEHAAHGGAYLLQHKGGVAEAFAVRDPRVAVLVDVLRLGLAAAAARAGRGALGQHVFGIALAFSAARPGAAVGILVGGRTGLGRRGRLAAALLLGLLGLLLARRWAALLHKRQIIFALSIAHPAGTLLQAVLWLESCVARICAAAAGAAEAGWRWRAGEKNGENDRRKKHQCRRYPRECSAALLLLAHRCSNRR